MIPVPRFSARIVIPAIAAACLLLSAPESRALHRESPPAIRLTSGHGHFLSHTRSWGRYIAFTSEGDLLANGSTGRQVFIFSQFQYVCQFGSPLPTTEGICPAQPQPYLIQVTSGAGDPADPSVTVKTDGSILVAFDAYGTFNGASGAIATHRQIYVKKVNNGQIYQLTAAPDGDNVKASISGGGGIVAFQTTAPSVTGFNFNGNPSQIVAIEIADSNAPKWVVTGGRSDSTSPMFDDPGNFVTFESTADLLGDGHDTGTMQIFAADIDRNNPPVFSLNQVTNGDAMSRRPYITNPGGMIAFESAATNLPGGTAGPGIQIYTAPTGAGNLPTVTRQTNAAILGDCYWPSFNEDGTRIVVICTADPLQNGTTGNRAFVLDLTQPQLVKQINATGEIQGPISHSIGNFFITMASREDMTAQGACEHQIYIVDYYSGRWGVATQTFQTPTGWLPPNPNVNLGCADQNACTTDTCDGGSHTCEYTPANASCNDNNACTSNDSCQAGVCAGGTTTNCDDNNPCTTDSCDPQNGCAHVANTNACNDANPCTTGDVCSATQCHGTPVVCPDDNLCDGTRACNPQNGQCVDGGSLDCDDHNACTDDACDPVAGCTHTANTAACDDGNPCTASDACSQGACASGPAKCDDTDACTNDTCAGDGSCGHTPGDNFLLCEISGITERIEVLGQTIASNGPKLGSAGRQRRMSQRITRARRQMGTAASATERRLAKVIRTVDKQMKLLLKDVDTAGGGIDATLADGFRASIADVRARIERVSAQLPPVGRNR